MDDSSAVDVDRNVPNALFTSALGLKGPLRITPHGSEHKPHIILKRVDTPNNIESNGESNCVARFSFFAHKRFEVKPGKEIMFTVASADGSEGPFKEIALVLEADIKTTLDTTDENETNHSAVKKVDVNGIGNVQGLPPKMRKSYTKEKTYASFISKEPSSSLGFLGYPMNIAPNRVFSSACVQTDSPPPTPLAVTLVDVTSPPVSIPHPNRSPVQLPSPVSADHGREPHSDNLAQLEEEDMDDISRIERSLSPMDLSSPSCSESPVHSPFPSSNKNPTLESPKIYQLQSPVSPSFSLKPNGVVSRIATSVFDSPEFQHVTASTQVFETLEPPCETPKALNDSPLDEVSSVVTPYKPQSVMLEVASHTLQTSTTKHATTSFQTVENSQHLRNTPKTSNSTLYETPAFTPPKLPTRVIKEPTRTTHSVTLSDLFVKATSSASGFSHTGIEVTVEPSKVGNNISNGIVAAQEPQPSPSENAFASSSKVPLDNLRKVQPPAILPLPSPRVPIQNPSPPPVSKEVYIPAGSVGNPLGIRPSSNHTMTPNQRPLPSGPRSLRTAAAVTTAKKPVVVGANWSAARNPGSASTSANNSVLVTPSPSSSISASTNSTNRPTLKVTDLSRILSYGSPSPPPPISDPPPQPPQYQSGVSKWKPITDDEKASASSSNTVKYPPTPIDKLSTKTGQVNAASSSTSLSKPPANQSVPLSSSKLSDDLGNVVRVDSSSAKSPAKRPLPPSTPNSSDDNKQGDVVMEPPSKRVKTADSVTSSASKSSAAGKVQPEAAPVLKASTSKPPQLLTHPLPPKPLPAHIGSSYRPSLKREQSRSRSPDVSVSKRPATSTDWPATYCSIERRLQVHASGDIGVQKVVFNHDGTQFALICADLTLRIWDNNQPPAEIASLQHTSSIVSVLWMENDNGVITLCQDGRVSTWSRSGNKWIFTKIVTVPGTPAVGEEPMCMVYMKDRIAVSIPTFGVRVWLCISGTWQPQREIIRSGVTAIRFVEDGSALMGCCRDGVLWFCEVPNGTLRVHCFLIGKPISLDINPGGSHMLVGDEGGKARLITLRTNENKGGIEQTYTSPKFQGKRQDFPSVFATKGQAVLHGTLNGCALVWDKRKGTIVYGLKHPEDDPVQAAATFDGRPGVEGWMITGTKQGRLYWWPQPVAAASNHNDDSQRKRPKVG